MVNEEYYEAWTKVIEDYDYYYNNDLGSSLLWLWIVLGVVGLIIIYIICYKLDSKYGRSSYNSFSYDRNSYSYGGRNSVASGGGGGSW